MDNCPSGVILVGNCPGGSYPVGNCPVGSCPDMGNKSNFNDTNGLPCIVMSGAYPNCVPEARHRSVEFLSRYILMA